MLKYTKFVVVAIGLALILAVGCSDRGTNVPTDSTRATWVVDRQLSHVFAKPASRTDTLPSLLLMQIRNPQSILPLTAYVPYTDSVKMPEKYKGKPMPLLVLLAPQDGNQYFYLDHGLAELASSMIADGIIRPMVIVTVGNDHVFGGYFYGNSAPAGFMDEVLGDSLVPFLESRFGIEPGLIMTKQSRGIGGIGMGAYGAYRVILEHALRHPTSPGLFGSISVNDGPMDFDGDDGNGGMLSLIPRVFAEQPSLTPANFKAEFDSSLAWPVSRMFIGGSLAFSLHDTMVVDSVSTSGNLKIVSVVRRHSLADSTTLISTLVNGIIVGGGSTNGDIQWGFHLPFDSAGHVHTTTWGRWMANNLDTLLTKAGTGALDGVKMWFGTSPEADFSYPEQTASWISTLQSHYDSVTVRHYSGTTDNPATQNQYVYDLLREMLIFHSNAFDEADQ